MSGGEGMGRDMGTVGGKDGSAQIPKRNSQ